MGSTSVYIDDHLIDKIKKTGKPTSKIVRIALSRYFKVGNRTEGISQVLDAAIEIGASHSFEKVVRALKADGGDDR